MTVYTLKVKLPGLPRRLDMECEKGGMKVNTEVFGLNNWRMEFSLDMGRPISRTDYEEKKRGLVLDIFHLRCLVDILVRLLSRQLGYIALNYKKRDLRDINLGASVLIVSKDV